MAADVRLHRMRLVATTADASEAASDLELAHALINGVSNAPELAWERYAPLVHRIVSRAIGPDAEVEDVTQEIFYRLFARIGTLRNGPRRGGRGRHGAVFLPPVRAEGAAAKAGGAAQLPHFVRHPDREGGAAPPPRPPLADAVRDRRRSGRTTDGDGRGEPVRDP